MNRKRQSVFRAHRRGKGCFYLTSPVVGLQFRWKKGSTSEEWAFALKNRIEV